MQQFTFENGGQVDVGTEADQVILFQTHGGIAERGPARLTAEQALEVADALTQAAENAKAYQPPAEGEPAAAPASAESAQPAASGLTAAEIAKIATDAAIAAINAQKAQEQG